MRSIRPAVAALAAGAILVLSGCSLLGGADDPERDEESGEIVGSTDETDVFAIRVGDCVETADLGTEVETIPTRPCSEAHDSEVYASTEMTETAFPGDEAADTQADEFCYGEFTQFVGLAFEDSLLGYMYLRPTQVTWDEVDDREILCLVVDPEGGVTGTMKGAAR
jgi:hypothetical protein